MINSVFLNNLTDTLSRRAPPLSLENVYEAVKRVKKWRRLGDVFLLSDSRLNAISDQHGSDKEACLKAVIETFLRGEGAYQPSWRAVIWALYEAGENHIAHDIITYAEPVQSECVCVCVLVDICAWLTSWGCGTRL